MREIKFRAWDKRNKRFIEWVDLLSDPEILHALFTGFYEPVQYTGLKDKNGKGIYEGDIIRCDACDGKIYEVKWYDGKNDFVGQLGWNLIASEAEQTEVIGNIYENPELLK